VDLSSGAYRRHDQVKDLTYFKELDPIFMPWPVRHALATALLVPFDITA
jgi:hypothetical protein